MASNYRLRDKCLSGSSLMSMHDPRPRHRSIIPDLLILGKIPGFLGNWHKACRWGMGAPIPPSLFTNFRQNTSPIPALSYYPTPRLLAYWEYILSSLLHRCKYLCTRSVLISNTVQNLKIPGRAGPRTKQGKGLRFEPIFLKCEKWTFPELIPSSFVATRAFRGAFSSLRVFGSPCYLFLSAKPTRE